MGKRQTSRDIYHAKTKAKILRRGRKPAMLTVAGVDVTPHGWYRMNIRAMLTWMQAHAEMHNELVHAEYVNAPVSHTDFDVDAYGKIS